MFTSKRLGLLRATTVGSLVAAFFVALLASATAHAIARGYTSSDSELKVGMVAALVNGSGNDAQVERATQENVAQIVGVVTNVDNSLVTVASSNSKVLVETEGQVEAYVSDMGGEVTAGSVLGLSPIKGVLMKVPSDTGAFVVGVASEGTAGNPDTAPYDIQNGSTKQTVHVTKIKIDLNRAGITSNSNAVDSSLSRLGKAIVGKEVSEIRVIIALVLFLIVLLAEGAIVYGAVSSAITALGRNPLARAAIRGEMLRVIFVAIVVLLIGLGAIYGILWA